MKLRAILEGRWYTGRNAHQIWAEWAVWARWQILNGSQFFFHFNEKRLSVDNISWIYHPICLDKIFLLIHLWDCCDLLFDIIQQSSLLYFLSLFSGMHIRFSFWFVVCEKKKATLSQLQIECKRYSLRALFPIQNLTGIT